MMQLAEYVTHPVTRTVHLVDAVLGTHTLCGRHAGSDWEQGDETISGLAATCAQCRRVFGREVTPATDKQLSILDTLTRQLRRAGVQIPAVSDLTAQEASARISELQSMRDRVWSAHRAADRS
jgi:hypothetical protein